MIPFLGAGAGLCDRPDGAPWEPGVYLPNSSELARALAERADYPLQDDDLLRISQYVDAMLGERDLYEELHEVFSAAYPPSSLHHFLASLAPVLRDAGKPQQLVLTTNYDDALERAFTEAGEPYDVVWYEAKRGSLRGLFLHQIHDGEQVAIERPNEYVGFSPDRTVIVKLHGAVDRTDPDRDSYVITEDHYIEYLSRGDVGAHIPATLLARMSRSHFLFLGYSLRDWNLRVLLHRLWGMQQLDLKSWAVLREPSDQVAADIEQTLWRDRGDVDLLYVALRDYVEALRPQFAAATSPSAA